MNFKLVIFFSLFLSSVMGLSAAPLPVEAFASLPDVSQMTLSPNGELVASLVRVYGKEKRGTAVSIFDSKTQKQSYPLFTDNLVFTIASIHWANDKTLLVEAKFAASRNGTPTTEMRLLSLDVNSGKHQQVLSKSFIRRLSYSPNILSEVIDYLPDDKNGILMSLPGFKTSGEHTVVRVSLDRKGKTYVEQASKRDVFSWLTDTNHQVRIAVRRHKTQYDILEKLPANGEFRTLWSFEAFSEQEVWPLGFGADVNLLYVKALYQGKDAIFSVDLNDKSLSKTLIYADDNYDVAGAVRRSKLTNEVIGISRHFWHPDYQAFQQAIDKALPETNNYIVDFSADERRYLLLATSATEPGVYLLGDRDNNTLKVIAYKYQALVPEVLSAKQAISYQARDGLTIEGYLTLPNTGADKKLPTIIFPHGGPISFDGDDFDYWTQFLANRGYAVLQMNFRGSSGYGFDFMQQGIDGWGKAMQDDVEDGANWLIAQGVADKNRMCIVGASYGGYAALMGAIKKPDLYRCVVSFAGVSDVEHLVRQSRRYLGHEVVKKQIGSDYDELWQRSPLKYAASMKPPVLLMHGNKDRTVNVRQSEEMYQALQDAGKNVKYVELDGGDHYLSNNQHRLTVFREMEQFLAQYLQ